MALVATTCDPSIVSSRNISMGSQSAECVAPWHCAEEDISEPEAMTAWNCWCELLLHSWEKTLCASDVSCKRASAVIFLEILNADEFAASICKPSMKDSQLAGLRGNYI